MFLKDNFLISTFFLLKEKFLFEYDIFLFIKFLKTLFFKANFVERMLVFNISK